MRKHPLHGGSAAASCLRSKRFIENLRTPSNFSKGAFPHEKRQALRSLPLEMKRTFGALGKRVLRFMAAAPPLHACEASAS